MFCRRIFFNARLAGCYFYTVRSWFGTLISKYYYYYYYYSEHGFEANAKTVIYYASAVSDSKAISSLLFFLFFTGELVEAIARPIYMKIGTNVSVCV